MAEDESKRTRFKSKWSRVFKEKEEHEQNPQHTNSFKLDEDVTEFLKPSTDKAAGTQSPYAPKIDIAIAKRWPDAHEVRTVSARTPSTGAQQSSSPNGFRKPRRRDGLAVGFVKTVPEIIGEGGDEAEDPASEVGRQKAMRGRSHSERRPGAPVDGSVWSGNAVYQDQRQAGLSNGNEEDFRPQPLRRAGTSHHEVSPPLQKKQLSPPVPNDASSLPVLTRMPTGLGSKDEQLSHTSIYFDETQDPVPQIDTRFDFEQNSSPNDSAGSGSKTYGALATSPRGPEALAARKRELRSGEGMILRRASKLITDDKTDEQQKRQSLGMGVRPTEELYETLARPDAESLMPEVAEPTSAKSPNSAASATGPSPFADPNYIKRHSREVTPERVQPQPLPAFRQQPPTYQPSYMRTAQHSPQQPPPPQSTVPQVQAPFQWTDRNQGPAGHDEQPSYVRTLRAPSRETLPSQTKSASRDSSSSRERLPFRDRMIGYGAASDPSHAVYSRPNGSNGSVNHYSPSPQYAHSRGSSRDGGSPRQFSSGSGFQQSLPSPKFHTHSPSPQSRSPRTSVVGKSSMLSPYGREISPGSQESLTGSRASPARTARLPSENLQIQESGSRPGTSSSNQSFQRGASYFSAPRAPQPQQPQPASVNARQEEPRQPSVSEPPGSSFRRTEGYASTQQVPRQAQNAKSVGTNLRPDETQPSGPSEYMNGPPRPSISPQPTSKGNPAADAAYADFAARVAHMKGVFRLTAEKERPSDHCTPQQWLRGGLWWYLKGKAGLEVLLQQRPRSTDGQPRELLTQPHVDLAKSWWILSDILDHYDVPEDRTPQSASSPTSSPEVLLRHAVSTLRSHIKSLTLSMSRNQLMPPHQSLIQGQNTWIWLDYPRFSTDAAAVLSGTANTMYMSEQSRHNLQPLEAFPLGDTRDVFCYGRFPTEVSIRTDEANTDRAAMPCVLTMLRGKRDFLTTIVIASQNELINVRVSPRQSNERGLTWHDVSWKASSFSMLVRLPRGFDLSVRMQERDFRALWNLTEYARKMEHRLRAEPDETLVHEAKLAELQYTDSSNVNAFPSDKLRRCTALVFERKLQAAHGGVERKMHRGYRLLLITDPDHKSLAHAGHEIGTKGPLYFEFITDAAAHGMAAMVIRIREASRQCRILLVFPDIGARQNFYDVLNGLALGPDETIVGKMSLASMNIEPATQVEGFTQSGHPALQMLQWQKLGVTNFMPDDQYDRNARTIESESLRLMARHATGCITDRLNLSKGELLVRLPCTQTPSIQVLRIPQEDISMSIDTRQSNPSVTDGVAELMRTVHTQSTIRSYTFASHEDLHAFQTAITGLAVRYDGLASTLSIARRRMVVPIYKKWEASNVRLQLVSQSNVVQFLAFMEGFSHADALCFQVKSTDVFENVKGDAKSKKWAVKMVDAKFSLPQQQLEKGEPEISTDERVKRRYVNLEMLEYAEEHDDITVGFDTQEERDRFAQALPAAATVSRGITLKRRI